MAENSKYYTPEIEEFHVGFEYEIVANEKDWVKKTFSKQDLKSFLYEQLENGIKQEYIRVKYLDKEDIESFGFKHIGSMWFETEPSGELGHWTRVTLRKWKGDKIIITGWRGDEQGALFSGDIRNKSELEGILRQLKVITTT